jgi:hypothetical protein
MSETLEQAGAVVAAYEALVKRAVLILNGDTSSPPWGYVGNEEWAKLSFDGDDAVVTHPDAGTYYDSITIDTDEERFPAALLFMSEQELEAWRKKVKAEYEIEQKETRRVQLAEKEAQERQAYELLRQKFESR